MSRGATSPNVKPASGRPPRTVSRKIFTFRNIILFMIVLILAVVAIGGVLQTTRWIEATGYIVTDQEVELRPSVEGAIKSVNFRSGQRVKENEIIVQLNDMVQKSALEQAESELAARKAELKQIQSRQKFDEARRKEQTFQATQELALSKQRLERIEGAMAKGGGFSRSEIEDARLKVNLAQSRVTELELPLDQVWEQQLIVMQENIMASTKRVALHQSEVAVRKVRSPMTGIIYLNRFEPGEVVKPDHVLGQVFGEGPWVVKLKVPERFIGYISEGQEVKIETSAYPAYRFGHLKGEVTSILPIVTPRATGDGIFYVEATIEANPPYDLTPGMTATADINTGTASWLERIIGW